MASSSKTASQFLPSSSASRWKYDVFLSFRGPDTRKGVTFELNDRLHRRGIKTFKDDRDLEVGDAISPSLLTAIEESRFAIVVLSPNYASSIWCLEELAHICRCMKDENKILPLFYNVDPTDVRYQKTNFKDAFSKHENSGRHESNKVQQWRDALNKVATFSGWHMQNFQTDRELVNTIVDFVCSKVLPRGIKSTGDFEVFEATRQAMDKVMKALKDDEITSIGVYGMGGVGKTSLVEHVGQEAQNQGLFDHVIKVVVTQTPDLKKIQGRLADSLGIKLMEETDSGRASRLTSEIMRRNKILIILDDVWDRIDLPSIGVPSYNMLQCCDSKVLLTARIWNVFHVMRSHENITLNSLSNEDSWTLFVQNARRSFESTYFEDVARKVVTECGGLPIALIAVARALGDKDLTEWKKAAQRLEKSQAANLDDKGDASKCIKLSYGYLKDEDCKSFFLLCCLFPEDYDIPIEDLFKYAIGNGLFQVAETIQEAREEADSVAKHLKQSSLLLDSEFNGYVKMHDVIRDTAIQIAQTEDGHKFLVKAGCGLKNWPCRLCESYSAISLMKNDIRKLPEELVCSKLQILLLQENDDLNEIPDTFFKSLNALRVLDLSHTSISSLSNSFILLSNLQALYLDSCKKIIDISILKNFKKLEILSMKEYPLKELPTEIGNLTNLRMLDVSGDCSVGDGIVRIPSEVISKLHRLEELCLQCGFWDWGSKVEGEGETTNAPFDEVTGLSYLNNLKVCISNANCIPKNVKVDLNWAYFDICIGRDISSRNIIRDHQLSQVSYGHKYSRSLILDTTIGTLPAWFVNVVTMNTEKLKYVNSKWLNNIIVEYNHGRLHSLKHLFLIGPNESLEVLMNARAWVGNKPVFENLEELHLERMDSLKELCFGELPSMSLWNLKVLKVSGCPNLGNVLLPSKLLHRLVNLESLTCKCMPGMEYVFGCEGFEAKGRGLLLPPVLQSKLRVMNLLELDAVRSICNGPAPPTMFKALKSLFIHRCKFPGGLFTFDVAQCLFQVEDLIVERCPNLERVIEASKQEIVNNKKTVLPKLKNLVLVDLPMLYCGSATIDMKCPSLQHLYVKDCPNFSAYASDFQSRNKVQLNDVQDYINLRSTRLNGPSAWNPPNSFSKAIEKKQISVRNELLQNMPDLLSEITEIGVGIVVKIPEMMETEQKILRKIPRSIMKQMAESMDFTPANMEKLSKFLQKLPTSMVKQMPEFMEKGLLEKLPGLMEEMPGLVKVLPAILKHMPELVEMIKTTISTENLHRLIETRPEIMENLPQMMTESLEHLPQMWTESLEDIRQMMTELGEDMRQMMTELGENLPQMNESEDNVPQMMMKLLQNLPQMTELGENLPQMNESEDNVPQMMMELLQILPQMTELLENLPQMNESGDNVSQIMMKLLQNLPQMTELLENLPQMTELLENLPQMTELLENLTQMTESGDNVPQRMTEAGENVLLDMTEFELVSSFESFSEDFESEINSAQQ